MGRNDTLREIESLDPRRDYEQIYRLDVQYEFPLEIAIGTELGQIHTFAIPSIGALLGRTGEFAQRPAKRADDTALLLAEVTAHGFGSERGRDAVRRINRIHAPYGISQDDFRYVLTAFVVPAVRFADTVGYRTLTQAERDAFFQYYRRLGEHMAIKDLPGSHADMVTYLEAYEAEHLAYSEGGHRVAMANRDRMAGDLFPKLPLRLARCIVDVFVPTHIRRALALPEPTRTAQLLVTTVLRTRRILLRFLPSRTEPVPLFEFGWARSYPDGYQIDQLGPTHPAIGGCPVLRTE